MEVQNRGIASMGEGEKQERVGILPSDLWLARLRLRIQPDKPTLQPLIPFLAMTPAYNSYPPTADKREVHQKSFLYAVASRGEVTIYRQPWSDGKLVGASQVALKIPFAFPIRYFSGNAYDFSRDLSTIVYARPGGHADLYLLSQK